MRWVRRLALTGAVFALSSCSEKQDVFSPKGPIADKINKLQVPVFIAAGVVGVLVALGLVFVIVTGIRRAKLPEADVFGGLNSEGAERADFIFVTVPSDAHHDTLLGLEEVIGEKIVVDEIPYQVGLERLCQKIVEAVKTDRIKGISDVQNGVDPKHILRDPELNDVFYIRGADQLEQFTGERQAAGTAS